MFKEIIHILEEKKKDDLKKPQISLILYCANRTEKMQIYYCYCSRKLFSSLLI